MRQVVMGEYVGRHRSSVDVIYRVSDESHVAQHAAAEAPLTGAFVEVVWDGTRLALTSAGAE